MRTLTRFPLAVATALCLSTCEAPPPRASSPVSVAVSQSTTPPLFDTLGDLHRDIGSRVPAAQRYFDQGLRLAYGFNHEAAGRAFAEAARLDPKCAACVWGQALVLGPNINLPMDSAVAAEATALARQAVALSAHARPADRALIQALALRYADPAPDDRTPLDVAYADAMRAATKAFPEDDDIATLHAESRMDLSPWAYWTAEGEPTRHTPEIIATLERVLQRNPRHIGAMHYYIHATEASRQPERAEPYADALAVLSPGSGHLVHMPAHTYIRVGRYHDATLTNFAATTADAAFLAVCHGSNGAYPLGYVPHNWHFASMSAALTGSRTLALEAAAQTARRTDPEQLDALNFMQLFLVAPLATQVRFGDWDAILAQPASPATQPYPTALWHFARGMAHVRRGAVDEAAAELASMERVAADQSLAGIEFGGINRADRLLAVGTSMLRGELLLRRGKRTAGIAALREAAAAEDALRYDEPAQWMLPVRPYLGAALLEAGRPREAAEVYARDLVTYPRNGWSLFGLAQAQEALGRHDEAAATRLAYEEAWQWADRPLVASRY
jgi:tetratricopeptide (TPR) repeat protein